MWSVSDHSPEDIESKCELDQAAFGISSIETIIAAACTKLGKPLALNCDPEVHRFTQKDPELPTSRIEEGEKADLTLFDPELQWTFEKIGFQGH